MKGIICGVFGALLLMAAPSARGEANTPNADGAAVRKPAATLRSPKATRDQLDQAIMDLVAIGPAGIAAIDEYVSREIGKLAAVVKSRPVTTALDEKIETLRTTLQKLREDPELSKEQLKDEGLPALESLTAAWGKREAALAGWRGKRDLARRQAERLGGIVTVWTTAAAGSPGDEYAGRLAEVTQSLADEDAETQGILSTNARLATSLPADAVAGMAAVNSIRIACGLLPLLHDSKLCDAAAMHSSDMEANGFFAHQSPLPGKESFTDRAQLSGTSASGENIFMGSSSASDAIQGWFLSPGHHKNMLGSAHRRQGLGRAGKHWTQLFGR